MSLVINHNLMAENTARNLNNHYGSLSTSVERLSSGLRINSAADDAAGLAIRELMRADIATFNQGIRNANDAVSMIQTADGALQTIDEGLIRMKELAEQAATGTYDSIQRRMINEEYQEVALEIQRIANSTDFNGIKLLDGSLLGTHNGSGLTSTGEMKIHFGTANDSAEDYYYVNMGDATLDSLFQGDKTIRGDTTMTSVLLYEEGEEIQVNETTANVQGHQTVSKINGGGFGVVWTSDNQDGSSSGIYAKFYDTLGNPTSTEVRINSTTPNQQSDPMMTPIGEDKVMITWMSQGQDGSNFGVYGQIVSKEGTLLGGEFLINTTTNDMQRMPTMSTLSNGNVVVSWESDNQEGDGSEIYSKIYSTDGSVVKDEFRINENIALDQQRVTTSALDDGGFIATWASASADGSGWGVVARRFDANGSPMGNEFDVNGITQGSQYWPTVTSLNNGGYAISWASEHDVTLGREIYVKTYDSNNNVLMPETLVHPEHSTGNQEMPSLTKLDAGFMLTWGSADADGNTGMVAKMYTNNGVVLEEDFVVNDNGATLHARPNKAITTTEDGSFIITWQSQDASGDTNIAFKLFTPLIDVGTQYRAQESLEKVNTAITRKDEIRAHLGAMQNRLEATIDNLAIQAENLQASESRVSDTDVGIEMTNLVRNQILTQSAVAMLSQANNFPKMAQQLIGG